MLPDLKILFEDDHLLALDKPSGLVVNDSETQRSEETLEQLLLKMWKEQGREPPERSGIIHRLDKETSGVLLVAKTSEFLAAMQSLFKSREVKKEYVVIARGKVPDEIFRVDAPLGRNPRNTMKFGVVRGGKDSITDFERVKEITLNDSIYTRLKANPLTGRTHQIRVHLLAYGHPVASDPLYLGKDAYEKDRAIFPRLMLHANWLEFNHPVTHTTVKIESALPKDFEV